MATKKTAVKKTATGETTTRTRAPRVPAEFVIEEAVMAPPPGKPLAGDPVLDALSAKDNTLWLPVYIPGRTPSSAQATIRSAANRRGVKIETRISGDRLYVREQQTEESQ